jgi:hypothetical protein
MKNVYLIAIFIGTIVSVFFLNKANKEDSIANVALIDNSSQVAIHVSPSAQIITIEDTCINETNVFLSDLELIDKKQQLINLLLQFNDDNLSRKVLEKILSSSGISIVQGHDILRVNEKEKVRIDNLGKENDFLGVQDVKLINELITAKDVNTLLSLYKDKKIPANHLIFISEKEEVYTPLQLFLSLLPRQNSADFDYQVLIMLNELTDIGVKVRFHDLVNFTAENVSLDALKFLVAHYFGDIGQIFVYQEKVYSLASLAVTRKSLSNTAFLLAEGVSAEPLKYYDNPFDHIDSVDYEQLESFVSLLLDYGLVPNDPNIFELLKRHLNIKYRQQHKEKFNVLNPEYLSAAEQEVINTNVAAIFSIASEGTTWNKQCNKDHTFLVTLINKIFETKIPAEIGFSQKEENELVNIDLETKLQLQAQRKAEMEKSNRDYEKMLLERKQQITEQDQVTTKEQQRIDRQKKLLAEGDWHTIIEQQSAAIDITEEQKSMASFALAVMANAPAKEIIALIEQGVFIDPSAAAILIEKYDVEVLKVLYQHNFDFHYIYPNGSNNIYKAVASEKLSILYFLLSIGVDVNVSGKSGSPLHRALAHYQYNPVPNIDMLTALFNGGANASDIDKQFLASIALSDLEKYSLLINTFPQLKL